MNILNGVRTGTDASFDSLTALIANLSFFALTLGGILAVVFIIIGGIQLSVSAGNPGGQEKAKKTIVNAIGGLVLAISAGAIGSFLLSTLGN